MSKLLFRDYIRMSFYDILGIKRNASETDIKKAYKKCALKHHPDKGGNLDKFIEISRAYETLFDPEKRKLYDKFGEEGLQSNFNDPFNTFKNVFKRDQKCQNIDQICTLTLEEIYRTETVTIDFKIQKICQQCAGKGAKPGFSPVDCTDCCGTGTKVYTRELAPGFVQHIKSTCDNCNGSGVYIRDEEKCLGCNGKQIVLEDNTIEFEIPLGISQKSFILLKGSGHQHPAKENGDVKIIIKELQHPVFKRRDNDLIVEKQITLVDALKGFQFSIKFLDADSSEKLIQCHSVVNGTLKLQGYGLPSKGGSGDMIFNFIVQYPKDIIKGSESKTLEDHLGLTRVMDPIEPDTDALQI